MNELPTSWASVRLGEVASVVRGITFPAGSKEFSKNSTNVCCLRTSNVQSTLRWDDVYYVPREYVKRDDQLVQVGDILMSMANSYELVGKVAMASAVPEATAFGAFLSAVRPTALTKAPYLFHLLRSHAVQAALREGSSQTTNIANISVARLSDIVVPLAPVGEQQRIANKLDTVLARMDACRDRLARVAPLLKRFRQSVLAAATSGTLTEEWRAENPAEAGTAELEVQRREVSRHGSLRVRGDAARVSRELLYELPKSWAWVVNHRLASDDGNAICAGPFGTIFKASDFRSQGVPIIFLRHVGAGSYLMHKPGFMDRQVWDKHHKPYSVYGGELLVTKLGDPPGTACIYPGDMGVAMVTPDVMKMSVDDVVADSRYLMHFFNGPASKEIVEAMCFGVTRLRIDLSLFKTFPIPMPPRAEQTEVVRRVEALFAFADRLEARLRRAQTAVDRLTPSLLAKAFRGELVPQDPADEPAAELLKRLAAQREAAPTRPRRQRTAA